MMSTRKTFKMVHATRQTMELPAKVMTFRAGLHSCLQAAATAQALPHQQMHANLPQKTLPQQSNRPYELTKCTHPSTSLPLQFPQSFRKSVPSHVVSPGAIASATCCFSSTAPMGRPPAKGLAKVMMSGCTPPYSSCPHSLPAQGEQCVCVCARAHVCLSLSENTVGLPCTLQAMQLVLRVVRTKLIITATEILVSYTR